MCDRKNDPVFVEFIHNRRLTGITGDGPYAVESQSGQTYTVSQHDRIDRIGSLDYIWECTCPARKTCRHITAVVDMRWAEARADADYDGMDLMEREVL